MRTAAAPANGIRFTLHLTVASGFASRNGVLLRGIIIVAPASEASKPPSLGKALQQERLARHRCAYWQSCLLSHVAVHDESPSRHKAPVPNGTSPPNPSSGALELPSKGRVWHPGNPHTTWRLDVPAFINGHPEFCGMSSRAIWRWGGRDENVDRVRARRCARIRVGLNACDDDSAFGRRAGVTRSRRRRCAMTSSQQGKTASEEKGWSAQHSAIVGA